MQLNTGEVRSSVVVPTSPADGDKLMRVLVGKPQSKQMDHMLTSKLGGSFDLEPRAEGKLFDMLVGRVCQYGIKAIPIAQAAPKSSRVHQKPCGTGDIISRVSRPFRWFLGGDCQAHAASAPRPRRERHPHLRSGGGLTDGSDTTRSPPAKLIVSFHAKDRPFARSERVNKYVTWIKDFKATECTQPLDPGGSAPESLARGVHREACMRAASRTRMLPHLPEEVILDILNNLVPTESATSNTVKDLQPNLRYLSYASRVSRQLRRVAEPLLYRYIYPTRQLLETLCERPELGNHVHEVGEYRPPLTSEERKAVKPLHDRVHELAKGIYKWPVLDAFLEDSFRPELAENDNTTDFRDDNTTWLPSILCLAPHVQRLHLNVYQLECRKLNMLAQLLQLCEDRKEEGGDAASRTPAPLSKLRSLHLYAKSDPYHAFLYGFPPQDWLWFYSTNIRPLVRSTKLRTLKTSAIDWGLTSMDRRPDAEEAERRDDSIFPDGPPRRELYTSRGSHPNLESLSLCDNRSPEPCRVKEMLEAYPNLHTLVLKPSQRMARQSFDFSEYGIVLRERATGLRCLDLEFPGISHSESDGGAIGSLRHECTQLKQLRLPLAALLGLDPPGKLDLCDYLPISLRWFWTTLPEKKKYAEEPLDLPVYSVNT
ncbi:uncharacterized protein B0I36DRAFT_400350 [Microdochium trichocladiopsis]|uniref:DUF3638 domain-containing protein n=1 Tax=Microdochium trichocladiopsis TaxID=1682393 RepID=A0A9P8XR16_9PEZI|nr:uncharacterized protein B0I36DRAFT_400350 [Microdochium trichocladiopsis]KAH7012267.1 hypothetical protein B0I36DRAFT_400350 [Microdochium trichocladiopsis]